MKHTSADEARAYHARKRASLVEWQTLPVVGVQDVPAGDGPDEAAYSMELRNCDGCQSTLALDLDADGTPIVE